MDRGAPTDMNSPAGTIQRATELSSILESIPGMVAVADGDGRHLYANGPLRDFLGFEIVGTSNSPWADAIHTDDLNALSIEGTYSIEHGTPLDTVFRCRRRDGVYRWLHARGKPMRDQSGTTTHWYTLLVDIHDRRIAEQALEMREQSLRQLIDAIPALVWCATRDGTTFYLNKRLLDYSGLTSDQAGHARTLIVHPDDLPSMASTWSECLRIGRAFCHSYRLKRADGNYRWHEGRATPCRDDSGTIVRWYGVNVDVDDRRRAEQALRTTQAQLQRSARLADLAELSASIANELNQPLAAVITNGHVCQRWLARTPPDLNRARRAAERIIRDSNTAATVLGRVRALYKPKDSTRLPTDVNELIREVCNLLAAELSSHRVHVDLQLDGSAPYIYSVREQFQQALVNLVQNGIDAMDGLPAPKSLQLRTSSCDDGSLLIEVRDHGLRTVDASIVFDPFSSTDGENVGMGLAICRSIVEAHDGAIHVDTDSRGTVFTLVLPAVPQA